MLRWESTGWVFILLLVAVLITVACSPAGYRGGAAGGALGGIAGALLDSGNPWRGGVIGLALGSVAGATLTDIAQRGSGEAAYYDRPVEYRTENGRGVYRAEPLDFDPVTKCRKVHERVWEDGYVIRDQIREVCEGARTERRY